MPKKMEITVKITDDSGNEIVKSTSNRDLPFVEEFDEQGFRKSLDQIETAVLEARKEVSDEAVELYLSEVSKKKTEEVNGKIENGTLAESQNPYGIESELGTLSAVTHKITINDKEPVYETANDYFEPTKPRERYKTMRLTELMLDFATDTSYRKTAKRMNRIRNQKEGVIATTARNTVEREGTALGAQMKEQAELALALNGFTKQGKKGKGVPAEASAAEHLDEGTVIAAAKEAGVEGSIEINPEDYEDPGQTTDIFIDEVYVKRQASTRPGTEGKGKRKQVRNTVVQARHQGGGYVLNAKSLAEALVQLMGFLLHNNLLWAKQLVFYFDGEISLWKSIEKVFGFLKTKIILDWYHLDKKAKERLSMGMAGYRIRNAFLEKLRPLLWNGDVLAAIELLKSLPAGQIKSQEYVDKLIDYLERNKRFIPCYSIRAKLGLCNSSNRGEKANDIVVASRQKHNGMSWSKDGSGALAYICAAQHNNELSNWISDRSLSFEMKKAS